MFLEFFFKIVKDKVVSFNKIFLFVGIFLVSFLYSFFSRGYFLIIVIKEVIFSIFKFLFVENFL